MPGDHQQRTTREVFEDHLEKAGDMRVEEDIQANYADDVVVMTHLGVFKGHEGVRQARNNLQRYLPDATFEYLGKTVEGDYAYLEWTGRSPEGVVRDGTDGFVIRDGKIVAQFIHYTVDDHGAEDGPARSGESR